MASELLLGRHWFHRDHYDIPKTRKTEIEGKALLVSSSVIVRVIKSYTIPEMTKMARLPAVTESENMDMEEKMHLKFIKDGKTGVHYCPDWDFMAIHDKSPEFEACACKEYNK